MSNRIQFGAKAVATFMMVSTVLSISGFAALAPAVAQAVTPADYGLHEGDVISANAAAGDPDVYIVNDWGYKRLFVNPAIFNLYGHLGWDKIKQVSAATRDAFVTSGLFRNCETNDQKVYGLDVTSEDTAVLHWVNVTGAQAVAQDPNFFQKVFCINNNEQGLYGTGADYTSLAQVSNYDRSVVNPAPTPSASPTPSLIPAPSPSPTPLVTYPTITSVTVLYPYGAYSTQRYVVADITGYYPSACDNLDEPSVSVTGSRVDISLTMQPIGTGACAQIAQQFDRQVTLQTYVQWGSSYDLYVNGTWYWSGIVGR
jgi:hypothetical protein